MADIHPLLRRVLPVPALDFLRRALNDGRFQSLTLSRIPRATVTSVAARPDLDVRAILESADIGEWARIASCIEHAGLGHNDGGVNPGDRRAIAILAAHLRPRNVLEIGTHVGSSTLTLAAALAGTETRITTVDILDVNDPVARPWERYGVPACPADIVSGLAPVAFVVDDSVSFLARAGAQYDFIFLDGSHRATTTYRELPLALQRLAPGGVLLLHDFFPDGRPLWQNEGVIMGPYLAVRRLLQEGWPIKVMPLGRLPWPTKLGTSATSLAVVLGRTTAGGPPPKTTSFSPPNEERSPASASRRVRLAAWHRQTARYPRRRTARFSSPERPGSSGPT